MPAAGKSLRSGPGTRELLAGLDAVEQGFEVVDGGLGTAQFVAVGRGSDDLDRARFVGVEAMLEGVPISLGAGMSGF